MTLYCSQYLLNDTVIKLGVTPDKANTWPVQHEMDIKWQLAMILQNYTPS
jgi:hypothetical protein